MIINIKNFIVDKFNVKRPLTCVLFTFIIKMVYTLWFNKYNQDIILSNSFLANLKGDSYDYITAAVNLKLLNFYYPDLKAPGYSLIIYFFHLFTSLPRALDLVVIMQLILSSISVYILAKLGYKITKSHSIFVLIFVFYSISSFVSEYDRQILSESITVSILIFTIYLLYIGLELQKTRYYVYIGIGICIITYLRPVLITFLTSLLILFILVSIKNRRLDIISIKKITLFTSPLILILTLWGIRNYNLHQKIEPMMRLSGYYNSEKETYLYDLNQFVKSWSGDVVFWDATAEINWFGCGVIFKQNDNIKLPSYIFTSTYNYQSLIDLRNKMRIYDASNGEDSLLKKEICTTLKNYTQSFKSENTFLYYVLPFKIAAKFVINGGGTTNLFNKKFSDLTYLEKLFKLSMIILFLTFSLLGVFIAFSNLFRFVLKNDDSVKYQIELFLSLFIILSILAISFVFKFGEYRYFTPIYPFCLFLVFINNKTLQLTRQKH